MGRTAKPAALKLVEGRAPGRDSGGRAVAEPPPFTRLPPNPPTWLCREAREEWRRVVPELTRLGLIKSVDRATLSAYCECWARFVVATRMTHGTWTPEPDLPDEKLSKLLGINSQGLTRAPAVAIAEAASKELRGWAAEFGLTPSAEAKVAALNDDGPADDNPFG